MMKLRYKSLFRAGIFLITACLLSCKSGSFNVFKTASLHELYERKLVTSGLDQTAMGKAWIYLADQSIAKAVQIKIPYREKGYFTAEKVQAAAFIFNMDRGQKLLIKLNKKPVDGFRVYVDVWEKEQGGDLKFIVSSDSTGNVVQSDIKSSGSYIIRLQPELLAGGEYTLEITSGPSLAYPLKTYQNNQVRSFFGDGRDSDTRKHEGIDIFSAFRTPVLAIAPGTVTRVNESNLGGKVVWVRPHDRDFTLYYAHLDEQTVSDGQAVQIGDTLGRMGNTGNARTTPPHLHFGVYTREGAVDPLPFINPKVKELPEDRIETNAVNMIMRTSGNASLSGILGEDPVTLKNGTILRISAVSESSFRVEMPDSRLGYLPKNRVLSIAKPLLQYKIDQDQQELYDRPDSLAAVKMNLKAGQKVQVLGNFGDYQFVLDSNKETGWILK
ncbi:MAG: M23 family metallopeptidase [Daejeonella sp.]